MSKLNFALVDGSLHPFETLVQSIKKAAKSEANATESKLAYCLDLIAKHSGYNNWSLLIKDLEVKGSQSPCRAYNIDDWSEAFKTQIEHGNRLRRAVVKAFPKNALTFAQDDAIDYTEIDFYQKSSRPSGNDDEVSEFVRDRFKDVYPPEILEQAVIHVVEKGPWELQELILEIDIYSGMYD